MIVILMRYHGLTLQEAVDYVGNLCSETINAFVENKKRIPSWGPAIDDMVQIYVKGLQDWIVGYVCSFFCYFVEVSDSSFDRSLHWSFQTHRYFGSEGQNVKKHRIVKLLPLRA
jgi:hypothetical protein